MAKDEMVFIDKEPAGHLEMTNDTGADLKKGDFCVVMGFAGVADQSIAAGETGSFAVADGLLIQAGNFVSGQDTFAIANENVYWNQNTAPEAGHRKFSNTKTNGYYKVGKLVKAKEGGVIVFNKFRYAEIVA